MRQFSPTKFRQALQRSGVRHEQIALDSDRGIDSIRAYLYGRAVPPANVLASLADSLGVSIDDLFDGGETR